MFQLTLYWHPRSVFDNEGMESLLNRSIIPKLTMMMKSFVVNPRQQDMSSFKALLIWEDVIPLHFLVNILEAEFFPKWHQILYTWLSSRPNYNEVMRWYGGWKSQFSPALQANARVINQFNHALHVMNSALSGTPLPAHPPTVLLVLEI